MNVEPDRPALSADEAARLLEARWGVMGTLAPLPSERDQNFRVDGDDGARFVLKIAGGTEPADHLALQNEALARLVERAPWVPVPRLRPTSTGEVMPRVVSADGVERPVRLLTYLPGGVLAEARPHTPELLYDLGAKLGALDQAFVGWTHPAARRTLYWDITRSAEIMAAHGEAVADPERRGLIERVASLWEHTVQPVLPELRRSIVYNDANDHNVLVGDPGPDRGVTGFVDFGDMLESVTVSDPAIAVAYAMLGKSDPLTAATHVVAGYHTAFPLTEAELEVLFPLACARLAVSVCISGRRSQDKVPDAYLSISAASAWEALAHIAEVHPRFARNVLRAACGMEPCPNHAAVVAWLDANGAAVGPVTDPDPAAVPSIDLDLSVGTPLVEDPAVVGTEGLTDIVFGRMREAMVDVAIGHYDEARVWYTGAQYAGPGGEHPERRTIHLGVDVFAESGTPVLAPIDGRVHSVRNNVEHLDYGPTVILEHAPSEGPTFYTLYGHLGEEALALEPGTAVVRGQVFARIGPFAVNGRWPPHLHFQIVTDLLDREGEFPGVGAPIRRATWLSLSPDPNLALRLPRGMRSADRDATVLREARRRQLGPNLSLSYAEPLHIVRGRGTYLYDADGREYLDCVNNVCHVGHAHPRVVRAARDQMTVLNTNTRYLHEHVVRYAERLAATLPDPLSVCFFVNSGSEANELALRLARAHTGANDFVVVEGGYHGNTGGLVEVSHYKFAGPGGSGTPPHVHPVLMPDDYRGPYRRTDPECGVKYAEEVAKAIAAAERNSRRMAGFLVESLLSCGGQIELPPRYLEVAFAHMRRAGGVCIADEVQVGFGRVGSHMWGFETQGVVPDIVTLGKPIGNGHPLGAVVTTPKIAKSFDTGMEYFNTFGGNPVSCAVGLSVLDIMRDEALQAHALDVGTYLKDRLAGLMSRHPSMGDVRGLGLFLGIEFVTDRDTRIPSADIADYVVERAKDHGVLLATDGPDRNVIKIKPPLVYGRREADRLVEVVDRILHEDFVASRSR